MAIPTSGGAPVKVLEGVVLANFVVLKGGIYYIDRPSGDGGIYYRRPATGETRLQYFDFATRKSTTVARNLGNVDLPLTALRDGRTILYPRVGLLGRRPDAGGELQVTSVECQRDFKGRALGRLRNALRTVGQCSVRCLVAATMSAHELSRRRDSKRRLALHRQSRSRRRWLCYELRDRSAAAQTAFHLA